MAGQVDRWGVALALLVLCASCWMSVMMNPGRKMVGNKQFFGGMLMVVVGFLLFQVERRRERDERRRWVIVLAFAIMLAGAMFTMGTFGEYAIFSSIVNMVSNSVKNG